MSVTHASVAGPLVELTDYQAAHTIANGTITEAMQGLTDVTTANVSTSAHGYAPKAPNDATKFLDGTGAYSAPVAAASTTAPDGKPYNFSPAASPATVDDEFSDLTASQSGPSNGLNAKWSKHNLGTAGWLALSDTKAPGSLLLAIPSGQSADQAIYQTTPAGDFTIGARWSMNMNDGSRQMWALFAVDSSGTGISVSFDFNNGGGEVCLRPLTAWVQSGATVDIIVGNPAANALAGYYMTGGAVTAYLRKASGVYFGSMTSGDRIRQPGLIEATVTPSAFTNAFVGFGRIFTGGGAVNVALDYFRQIA